MIAHLSGRILQKEDTTLVIDTGSMGYQVTCPAAIVEKSKDPAHLFIYHHITEQSQALFGFESWEQRNFFKLLLSLSGVGPKVAMKILESVTMADLEQMVASEDMARLSKLPGLGAKSAEKVFLELKRKLPKGSGSRIQDSGKVKTKSNQGDGVASSISQFATRLSSSKSIRNSQFSSEITDALRGLGYKDYEINIALDEIGPQLGKDADTEEGLRLALSVLSS